MNFGFYMPTRLFSVPDRSSVWPKARPPQGTGLIITGGYSANWLLGGGYAGGRPVTPTRYTTKCSRTRRSEGVRECAARSAVGRTLHLLSALATARPSTRPRADLPLWRPTTARLVGLYSRRHGRRQAHGQCRTADCPTTAGTGTEADPFTVITNGEKDRRWRRCFRPF